MTDTSAAPIAYRMSTLNSSVSIGTMTIPPPSPVSAPTTPAPRAPSQTRSVSSRTLGAMPPCFSAPCDGPDTASVSTAMIVQMIVHRIAVTEAVSTPSMFAPVSTPAFAIRDLSFLVLGIVTANELHVPVSDAARPTRTFIMLESADVIHSFWIPQLAGKTDVIPGKTNRTWVEPRTPGTYVGQCAEFCGVQHAWMLLRVTVHPRDEFDRWVAAQRAAAADVPEARAGRDVFTSVACISCHTGRGTPGNGAFGPHLTHLLSP